MKENYKKTASELADLLTEASLSFRRNDGRVTQLKAGWSPAARSADYLNPAAASAGPAAHAGAGAAGAAANAGAAPTQR